MNYWEKIRWRSKRWRYYPILRYSVPKKVLVLEMSFSDPKQSDDTEKYRFYKNAKSRSFSFLTIYACFSVQNAGIVPCISGQPSVWLQSRGYWGLLQVSFPVFLSQFSLLLPPGQSSCLSLGTRLKPVLRISNDFWSARSVSGLGIWIQIQKR